MNRRSSEYKLEIKAIHFWRICTCNKLSTQYHVLQAVVSFCQQHKDHNVVKIILRLDLRTLCFGDQERKGRGKKQHSVVSLALMIWRSKKQIHTKSSTKILLMLRLPFRICWNEVQWQFRSTKDIKYEKIDIIWKYAHQFRFLLFGNQWFVLRINQHWSDKQIY